MTNSIKPKLRGVTATQRIIAAAKLRWPKFGPWRVVMTYREDGVVEWMLRGENWKTPDVGDKARIGATFTARDLTNDNSIRLTHDFLAIMLGGSPGQRLRRIKTATRWQISPVGSRGTKDFESDRAREAFLRMLRDNCQLPTPAPSLIASDAILSCLRVRGACAYGFVVDALAVAYGAGGGGARNLSNNESAGSSSKGLNSV